MSARSGRLVSFAANIKLGIASAPACYLPVTCSCLQLLMFKDALKNASGMDFEALVDCSCWHLLHCRKSILSDKPSFRQSAWQQISPEGKAFVQKLLNKYASPILTHPEAAMQQAEILLRS